MITTSRCKFPLSLSGLSIALALGLALWEGYFFFVAGTHPWGSLEGRLGVFTPNRLGFNLAWLIAGYLTYQLISIPFALPAAKERFIGVVDGMASLVPLAIVLVVVFGKPHLLGTTERWEAAILQAQGRSFAINARSFHLMGVRKLRPHLRSVAPCTASP